MAHWCSQESVELEEELTIQMHHANRRESYTANMIPILRVKVV